MSFGLGFKTQLQQDPCDITGIPVRICHLKSHRVMEVSENRNISAIGKTMPLLQKLPVCKAGTCQTDLGLHSTFTIFLAAQLQCVLSHNLLGCAVFYPITC